MLSDFTDDELIEELEDRGYSVSAQTTDSETEAALPVSSSMSAGDVMDLVDILNTFCKERGLHNGNS